MYVIKDSFCHTPLKSAKTACVCLYLAVDVHCVCISSSLVYVAMLHRVLRTFVAIIVCLSIAVSLIAQTNPANFSGKRLKRIVIRNATVVDGSGKPAAGPYDIVIENDLITQIVPFDAVNADESRRPAKGELDIDATGKYVLPGLINLHAHTQDERGGVP